ncbi:MAG: ABC transporter permease [Propionibacteriaceae bacterium]|nr:ABC transporter permease [Propionibacteriaceae bacterium]
MRHTLTETLSGLRRNASMTFAVVVTMWVSLALFGIGLLAAQQVDLVKGRWYDKIEISVFLCAPQSKASTCEPGQSTTPAQRDAIEATLRANPEVADVFYESKEEAFAEFKELFADSPVLATMSVDQMQDSFRVRLKDPTQYAGVVSAVSGMSGVESVQDLHKYLDPLFAWLNLARWATIGASVLLLLAAALQIGNTIRMAAHSRRREIGIMRLVGASNWYIMLPFLLESLLAAIGGAILACATLAALEQFVVIDKAKPQITTVRWLEWSHVGSTCLVITAVAVVLSIIPTLIATRRFLRV